MNIHRANASRFIVEGTCSEVNLNVVVNIGGLIPPVQPSCSPNGSWRLETDVTALITPSTRSIIITANHSSHNGIAAAQALATITSQICPDDFIMVPPLENYTNQSFCVAKYEMKQVSNKILSQPEGTPYANINRNDAINKCASMGANYDLITNDEWQTLARHIESVDSNWNSSSGHPRLNIGHHTLSYNNRESPVPAHPDDNKSCFGTPQTCNLDTWNLHRRTHQLPNGEIIWDLSGNVSEWVKDNNKAKFYQGYIAQLTTSHSGGRGSFAPGSIVRTAKGHFGSMGNYRESALQEGRGGLGVFIVRESGYLIRGSHSNNSSPSGWSGLFAAHGVSQDQENYSADIIGFRCIYNLPPSTP